MVKRINIASYVKWQLKEIQNECNFTPDEAQFFELRAKDKSLVAIAEKTFWSESKCNKLSHTVRKKILEVYPTGKPEKRGS